MAEAAKSWLLSKLRGADADDPSAATKLRYVVDSKTTIKLAKYLQEIIIFAANKRLNLKNSPPYLHGIVTETGELIHLTFKNNPIDVLKANEYLNIFIANLIVHCKRIIKLFKDAKEEMEVENSKWRRELNKLTLVFSHMLSEFKAFFNAGKYVPDFKLVKIEARDFWEKAFAKRVIVPWAEFIKQFSKVHKLSGVEEAKALKGTIDMLDDNFVSWFEFDIFTRLFQPWQHILNNWNIIVLAHPGYQAFMTYDEVESVLQKWIDKPGSYVFRLSCTRLGQWAIGYVTPEHKIVQTIPHSKSLYQALIDGVEERTYLFPNGQDVNPDIRRRVNISPEQHIKVTKEQYELYCDIDTTFELCKICDTNLKNIRIDPCGHLLCKDCLVHWMETSGQTRKASEICCPFCRELIMSTETVIIDPFDDDDDDPSTPTASATSSAASTTTATSAPRLNPPLPAAREMRSSSPVPPSSPSASATATPTLFISAAEQSEASASASAAPPIPPKRLELNANFPNPVATVAVRKVEEPNSQIVQQLIGMGFQTEDVRKALRIAKNDINVAMDILMSFS
eukprot:m.183456 g.183456  ORF g.183456 m.183456 type:complete len:566 (-) comp53499_c0_seq1:1141-2838(-)